MKRLFLYYLILNGVFLCDAFAQNGSMRGSPLSWNKEVLHVGPVLVGDSAECTFWFRNDSDRTITIQRVLSNNKEVEVFLSQKRLKPKEVAYLIVTITSKVEGHVHKELEIETDFCKLKDFLTVRANFYNRR